MLGECGSTDWQLGSTSTLNGSGEFDIDAGGFVGPSN